MQLVLIVLAVLSKALPTTDRLAHTTIIFEEAYYQHPEAVSIQGDLVMGDILTINYETGRIAYKHRCVPDQIDFSLFYNDNLETVTQSLYLDPLDDTADSVKTLSLRLDYNS